MGLDNDQHWSASACIGRVATIGFGFVQACMNRGGILKPSFQFVVLCIRLSAEVGAI